MDSLTEKLTFLSHPLPSGKYKKLDNFLYTEKDIIGKGTYGKVYKAYDSNNEFQLVAVKVLPTGLILKNEEELKSFMREFDILKQVTGEHFVQLFRTKETKNHLYLFMEYCNEGDLATRLMSKGPLTEIEALNILDQITQGFLSLNNIVIKNKNGQKVAVMHRDIKPANILFSDGVLKIVDFGYAKMVDESTKNKKENHTCLGTPLYTSPQILNAQDYSIKCDIWSTGCLFYECLFGCAPWTGNSISNLYKNIMENPLKFKKKLSPETEDLLLKMLQINEEDRIDWKGIYSHPALIKYRNKHSI